MAGLLDNLAGTDAPQVPPSIPDRSGWDFSDVARSFGSGLVSGAGMLAGLPGDVRQLIAAGHDTYVRPIERRLGYEGPSPEVMRQIYAGHSSVLPSSDQLALQAQAVLGQPHQPQTDAGDVAYKIGEKIPGVPLFLATRGLR
ncbi:hypothetical protein JQ617_06950 [Bradyrhizobium sp. KB893862 SZCCT0404]|uniref:hypothetical protein n=1 Tax=Bradyrhizobium sp. KB893862 SZCCT0404 TaxID=2807672 RepID=UPI001BAB8C1B|nr:hypothetical protein [Bradyrhizobium sp. KB893862 SZCCT0404]MBR1173688.1 hypothetical protein [Bradyrhizobium sp. KB893862 SZCCT0404]